jgi:hypothetical protein
MGRAWLGGLLGGALVVAAVSSCATGQVVSEIPPGPDGGVDAPTGDTGACTTCGGACVDLKTDGANCGKCGNACSSGAKCVQGTCQCDANAQKCGTVCVDLKTDAKNCGQCGVVCGGEGGTPMGGGTWGCAAGTCSVVCPMGKAACMDACVDTKTDNANCGACGTQCDTMMGKACKTGLCCQSAESNCGGTCTNTLFDAKNCGACGTVCPMNTPNCANGMCTTCNNTLLVLDDGNVTAGPAFVAKANAAGLSATLVANGVATYTGTPAATGFGAIILLVGDRYDTDMPLAGQQAIVAAQAANRGVVITDWGGYHPYNNRWATLKSVNLYQYTTGGTGTLTFTLTQMGHPIWTGLPNGFSSTSSTMGVSGGTIMNGGTAIATVSGGGVSGSGVIVRSGMGGRIVYVAHAAAYSGNTAWTNDTNLVNLTLNAVKWSTGCLL